MSNIQINIYFTAFIALALSIVFNYLIFTFTKNTNYQKNTDNVFYDVGGLMLNMDIINPPRDEYTRVKVNPEEVKSENEQLNFKLNDNRKAPNLFLTDKDVFIGF